MKLYEVRMKLFYSFFFEREIGGVRGRKGMEEIGRKEDLFERFDRERER